MKEALDCLAAAFWDGFGAGPAEAETGVRPVPVRPPHMAVGDYHGSVEVEVAPDDLRATWALYRARHLGTNARLLPRRMATRLGAQAGHTPPDTRYVCWGDFRPRLTFRANAGVVVLHVEIPQVGVCPALPPPGPQEPA